MACFFCVIGDCFKLVGPFSNIHIVCFHFHVGNVLFCKHKFSFSFHEFVVISSVAVVHQSSFWNVVLMLLFPLFNLFCCIIAEICNIMNQSNYH